MKVLCIGHASYDITLPVEGFPRENTKTRIGKRIECGGGPASNAAYLLAKWKMETFFAGVIGNDLYGKNIDKELKQIGVNTTYLESKENYRTTAAYIIANTETGTRTILSSKDEKKGLKNPNIEEKVDIILIDGEEKEASIYAIKNNPHAISIIDAGRVTEDVIELCKLVNYVVCSKEFAETYSKKTIDDTNEKTKEEVWRKLTDDFNTNVIITLEANGCYTNIDHIGHIPSIKVKAIDSTGAGDIFHGAFTYFIANHYPLKKALYLSNITGALSVTKIGGRYSIPELEEVFNQEKVQKNI